MVQFVVNEIALAAFLPCACMIPTKVHLGKARLTFFQPNDTSQETCLENGVRHILLADSRRRGRAYRFAREAGPLRFLRALFLRPPISVHTEMWTDDFNVHRNMPCKYAAKLTKVIAH